MGIALFSCVFGSDAFRGALEEGAALVTGEQGGTCVGLSLLPVRFVLLCPSLPVSSSCVCRLGGVWCRALMC